MQEFTKQHFDILRKNRRGEEAGDPSDPAVRDTMAYLDARMAALLTVVRGLEESGRTEAWKRRIPALVAQRQAVSRQLADTLVRQARALRQAAAEAEREMSLPAIGRAVSLLSGGHLAPEDVPEVAVRIGSVLAEGRGRWEVFPGPGVDEREREMIGRVIPLLPRDGTSGPRREEALYLDAVLRMAVKDPGAGRAAP